MILKKKKRFEQDGKMDINIYLTAYNPLGKITLKSGETTRSVSKRIQDGIKTIGIEKPLILFQSNFKCYKKDFDKRVVFKFAKEKGYYFKLHESGRESEVLWHPLFDTMSNKQILEMIKRDFIIIENHIKYNTPLATDRYLNYDLLYHQQDAIDMFNQLPTPNIGPKSILLDHCPRGGKSFTALYMAIQAGCRVIVILTGEAVAIDSFKQIGKYHTFATGHQFHDKYSDDVDYSKGKHIIFCSLQDLKNKKGIVDGELFKARHKYLYENGADAIIYDECHNGTFTLKTSQETNVMGIENGNQIKAPIHIYTSATPKCSQLADVPTHTYSIYQMMEDKKNGLTPHHKNLPSIKLTYVENDDLFNGNSLSDHFDNNSDASQQQVGNFFKGLSITSSESFDNNMDLKPGKMYAPLSIENGGNVFFGVCDKIKHCRNIKSAIKDLPVYKDMDVIILPDSSKLTEDTLNKRLNKNYENNKKSLILTCYKFTVGVTIPRIDNILMFTETTSYIRYMQTAGRGLSILVNETTGVCEKKVVNVYDFCTDRGLSIIIDDIKHLKTNTKTKTKTNTNSNDVHQVLVDTFDVRTTNLKTGSFTNLDIGNIEQAMIKSMAVNFDKRRFFTRIIGYDGICELIDKVPSWTVGKKSSKKCSIDMSGKPAKKKDKSKKPTRGSNNTNTDTNENSMNNDIAIFANNIEQMPLKCAWIAIGDSNYNVLEDFLNDKDICEDVLGIKTSEGHLLQQTSEYNKLKLVVDNFIINERGKLC